MGIDDKKSPDEGARLVTYEERLPHNTEDGNTHLMPYLTPVKSIRAYCLDCCCGSWLEVKLCPRTQCALYPYRFGKRPKRNGTITDVPEDPSEDCPELEETTA